jgi:uncharacterized protein YdeI (YjbR/CyaY-like superfamily)
MTSEPTFFAASKDWRAWLEENHATASELLVGFYKVGSGKPSMTWPESVDQALCFGWIDGVRKRYDDESYTVRFTPRRAKSTWSAVNINKVEVLKKKGLLHPSGIAAYERRDGNNSRVYSFENEPKELDAQLERLFRKNKQAWQFFNDQPPWYRRMCIHWVMTAKQEKTRLTRLEKLIAASEAGKRV